MGKKDEQRKKFSFYDEGENSGGDGSRRSKNDNSPMSSDDEEANEDLSLKIVEKARLMRAAKFVPDESGEYDLVLRESRDCAEDAVGGAVGLSSSSVRQSEAGCEGPSGPKGGKVVVASVEEDLGKKKIRKVKKKLKIKKVEAEENVDIVKEERSEKVEDLALSVEPKDVGMKDNIVFRKLLRGPRYFDPPGNSLDACFNCGEEGHNAVNCTAPKRKKPCFVCGSLDHNVDIVKEEGSEKVEDLALSSEPKDVGMTDNIVFRKLLRGPRYFDPPGSSWDACFNCGKEGHNAVNCTAPKRKKPCFVCGSLDHNAKSCSKAQNCFICKKDGHRAKNCSEGGNAKSKMCLKCGDSGHDMFFCQNDYLLDDLKNIQCYICKNFGHLCCISPTNATQEVSCYKCGQSGHTGLACARLRQEVTGTGTPSSCYKCGEEGHFARECLSSSKASARLSQEVTGTGTPSSCYKCGEEGHFARECLSSSKASARLSQEVTGMATPSSCFKCGEESHFARECPNSTKVSKRNFESTTPAIRFHRDEKALSGCKAEPNNLRKGSRKKKPKYEQIDVKTPQKSRCRGGWIVDDPRDFSPSRSKIKHWGNPVTPPSRIQMAPFSYNDNYTRFRPSPNMHNVYSGYGYPMSQGSNYGFQPRFSSSRFANSGGGSGGMWRNHNW